MSEEDVDLKLALMKEPIVGMENVTWEEGKGPGAIPARPLSSPKEMSLAQRLIHDINHLPYDPACPICVSCRRPNSHHRCHVDSGRTIPLLVADYAFPQNLDDGETLTLLIMRVYPYKLYLCCIVPQKGRDPRVVARIVKFIKDTGLTHFAFRSDREPAIAAMIDEACALSGRRGVRVSTDTDELSGGRELKPEDIGNTAGVLDGDLAIDDAPHVASDMSIETTHVATPELSHPGESQSNGLAEKSVRDFVDHLRTLKTALEARLKVRLSGSHPVVHWLVEHTAYVLNKFALGPDGHTAYGRLHGREGRERICEFGERIMWYVPKKLRAKLDQRWRYGIFLGRSMSSDQNYVGLVNGDVICARAIVRVVPSIRWDADKVGLISITPHTFKTKNMDVIEEDSDPHSHPEPQPSDAEARSPRRLKIFDSDLRTFGYTEGCPRCEFVRKGQNLRARGARHNEECRHRLYEAMREAGVEKMKRADMEDSTRTLTKKPKKKDEGIVDEPRIQESQVDDAPMEPIDDTAQTQDAPVINESDDMLDTTNFYEEVNAETGHADNDIEVEYEGEDLHDGAEDHVMTALMDVLQTLGVSAADSANYGASMVKNRPVKRGAIW